VAGQRRWDNIAIDLTEREVGMGRALELIPAVNGGASAQSPPKTTANHSTAVAKHHEVEQHLAVLSEFECLCPACIVLIGFLESLRAGREE
jgi:hypothetical protein